MLGDESVLSSTWWKVTTSIASEALNFIGYLFYAIFTGVGMLINFVLSLFKQLAGIEAMTLTAGDKYITVGGEGNWTDITYAFITSDAVSTTFWTIFGMCIALLVVFTIFAIVKSEFSTDVKNAAKLPILERAVKSVINFLLIPVISLASLYGANMLTKAVYYTFNSDSKYYITNVIFNAGATQANRASLDDGFANFLLASDTVYFAEADLTKPRDVLVNMLNNYFAVDSGYIKVYEHTVTRVADLTETLDSTKDQSNLIATVSLDVEGQSVLSVEGDELHIADELYSNLKRDKYKAFPRDRYAGSFDYLPNSIPSPGEKAGDQAVYYTFQFQLPVKYTFVSQEKGFTQTVYSCSLVDYTLAEGENKGSKSVIVTPRDPSDYAQVGEACIYTGVTNTVFGQGSATITADSIDGWWGQSGYLQSCAGKFSTDAKNTIVLAVNDYINAVNSETDRGAAKLSVVLWDVLKYEYNTDTEEIFKGDRPNLKVENDITSITAQQRTLLAEFIDRLFVGDGNGGTSYCVYWVKNQADSFSFAETKPEDKDAVYLEISSKTLHVEKRTRADWEDIVKTRDETFKAETRLTPDVQYRYWSPWKTHYSGEAVMDMGLVGYFYKFNNMNLVMMLFGMVAIAWQYFKLILVFVKRALEMVLLFLMAPVVTAIAPLDKGNAENSWRSNWIKQLTMTAVPVFAINIFFTIVPLVSSLNMFANTNPLALTYNAFVSIIFIYVGISMINRASALLAGFLGTEDMISQGKDLTGKATGVVGTATKGAALVTGVALAGPAAAIKAGMSMKSGRKARKDSLIQSRKDALSDIDNQIKEAKEAGDSDRVSQLKNYRDNYDSFRANSASGQQFSKAQKDEALERLGAAQKAKESDEADLAKLRAEQESLASVPMQMGRQKKWNAEEKKAWEAKKADIEAQIAQKQSDIAEKNATIADAQRQSQYYANDERFYSNFAESQKTAKSVGKEARSAAWKKLNKDGLSKWMVDWREEKIEKPGWKQLDNAISHIPGINWAVNKVLWNAAGLAAQVADRKFFADTPKNAMDFVKGVSGDAGKIAEKFMDPGTIGKVISTDDENKFRETVKEEKARKKAWEEQIRFEDDKLNKQKKAQDELETKRQLKEYERYKMGAFDVQDGKLNINAKNAETIAKNYEKTINSRADQDFKNNVHKDDKNFAKFKQMLKEMEDESKKKAQNVKIDPRDKGFGEQVINAMKTVNAQNNRELKNINSGIASLSKNIEDLVKKMSNNS